jgi:hypothetical protein
MFSRIHTAMVGVMTAVAIVMLVASSAHASLLSLLPGSCGNQVESQPFAPWGDYSKYTPVAGGNFEAGGVPWVLTGGAHTVTGNESYDVSGAGSQSLALPAGSSALSPASCTNIYHPTVRLFVRNTGAATSRLNVEAVYPTLLGIATTKIGEISGSSQWQPSPAMSLLVSNLLSTVSLNATTVAFRFVPADNTGNWSIDDVYIDPYQRG